MTDSPAVAAPLDPKEQSILDKLLNIRDKLELLKHDRSTYVKSQDVIALYNETIEQVELLNQIRVDKRDEQSRVDSVLDSCFQLISLAFMTIGRNSEAPAVYSAVSTVKRLLDHLKEAAFFSAKDLESIKGSLKQYRHSVEKGRNEHSPHLLTLLEARIDLCETRLAALQRCLSTVNPELMPTYEKLVSILRSLSGCTTKSKFPAAEVKDFERQLKEIEADLELSVIPGDDRSAQEKYADKLARLCINDDETPPGLKMVKDLLTRCLLWVQIIEEKQGKIDERFQELYDKLLGLRNQLDKLLLTQAWSLRETDLYSYQRQLDKIDEARVNGNFIDAEGKPADIYAQRTLLYLLRKSYALIYHLLLSSEPVSEALLPIYNQLTTLRRCLIEVKKSGGVSSPRELYPYSMKLNSIDNMRVDGKFMVGSDIPDGQGSVTELLEECFELAYELRNEAEAEKEEDKDDDDAVEIKATA